MSDETGYKRSKESEYLDDLEAAAINTAVEHLRAIHYLKQQRQTPLPDGTGCANIAEAVEEPWIGDFMFESARLQLEVYNRVLGLSSEYADQIIDRLRTRLPGGSGGTSKPHVVKLKSQPGGQVVRRFVVENRLTTRAKLLEFPKELFFRDASGAQQFKAICEVRRDESGQDPFFKNGERRIFRLVVTVPENNVVPGERYFSQLLVTLERALPGPPVQDELPIQLDVVKTDSSDAVP